MHLHRGTQHHTASLIHLLCTAMIGCIGVDAGAQVCPTWPLALASDTQDFRNSPSGVFVRSPLHGEVDVARDVAVQLGGTTSLLDGPAPQLLLTLYDEDGNHVAATREGTAVRPDAPLKANTAYDVVLSPTPDTTCAGCFASVTTRFTTGDVVNAPPLPIAMSPNVYVLALPSIEERQRCGDFGTDANRLVVDFGAGFPDRAFVSVVSQVRDAAPRFVADRVNFSDRVFSLQKTVGPESLRLGEPVLVGFSVRDFAGVLSPLRVVRVRVQSPAEMSLDRSAMQDVACDVDTEIKVAAAEALPTNGTLWVTYALEHVPLGLRADDGDIVSLVTVRSEGQSAILAPARTLVPDSHYQVIQRECPSCVCDACAVAGVTSATVTTAGDEDHTPPAPLDVVSITERYAPTISTAACEDDFPALVLTLGTSEPSEVQMAALRVSGAVTIDDVDYPLPLSRPVPNGDNWEVALDVSGLPRILGNATRMDLIVEDAAGNATPWRIAHPGATPTAESCATTSATPLAVLILLWRRRAKKA